MTEKPSVKTEPQSDGLIADTVWCIRQATRALSGIFTAAHAVGSFTERSLKMVSHFADAADSGMNRVHKWLSKPQTDTVKPQL